MMQQKKNQEVNVRSDAITNKGKHGVVVSDNETTELNINLEIFPADVIKDKNALIEITDNKILDLVNNFLPELAQVGNAANNAVQAVRAANDGVLYRAIIPTGTKLTESKSMKGAVRGFYQSADGIQGHANLVAVEASKKRNSSKFCCRCYGCCLYGCLSVLYDTNKCSIECN